MLDLAVMNKSCQIDYFRVVSSQGNKHFMLACEHDSNSMLTYVLKAKTSSYRLQGIESLHSFLNQK